jgi:hypothetical protein
MTKDEEKILGITKEILVKFIEIGRVSPTQFDGVFQSVFQTVKSSVSLDPRVEISASTASAIPKAQAIQAN